MHHVPSRVKHGRARYHSAYDPTRQDGPALVIQDARLNALIQRDRARAWAVALEQELAEVTADRDRLARRPCPRCESEDHRERYGEQGGES